MPYKRSYKPKGKNTTYGKSNCPACAKLAKRVNKLERLSGPEKKYLDLSASGQLVGSTPTITLLNGMIQGSTAGQRIGQTITMLSSFVQFDIVIAATVLTGSVFRMMIIYDKQSDGGTPASSDILSSGTNLESPLNIANSHRFKVLSDKRYNLAINGSNAQIIKRNYIKIPSYTTQYNSGNAGTVADIQSGSLFILYMSDESGVDRPSLSYYHRLRYVG